MKINVFEGARRIALLAAGLIVIGAVWYAVEVTPYAQVSFSIAEYGARPVKVDDCGSNDGINFSSAYATNDKPVTVNVCFVVSPDDKHEVGYIPVGPKGEKFQMIADRHSREGLQYMIEVGNNTKFPQPDVDAAARNAMFKQWGTAAVGAGIALVVLWIAVSIIGWIVRGFLGIPRGKDSRV